MTATCSFLLHSTLGKFAMKAIIGMPCLQVVFKFLETKNLALFSAETKDSFSASGNVNAVDGTFSSTFDGDTVQIGYRLYTWKSQPWERSESNPVVVVRWHGNAETAADMDHAIEQSVSSLLFRFV